MKVREKNNKLVEETVISFKIKITQVSHPYWGVLGVKSQ